MNKPYQRLFFALWPDQAVREQLLSRYRSWQELKGQGRVLPDYNIHMTVHFLGNIPLDKVDCFIRQAEKVHAKTFNMQLTHSGYFKRPKILWIGPENIPAELLQLHKALGEMISPCGYTVEKRPYNPHVTMARKIMKNPGTQEFQTIEWQVKDFVLIQSEADGKGVRYRVKKSFALGHL